MEDEVFDPEKVKRVVSNANFGEGWYDYDVVEAEDYDKLLAAYIQVRRYAVNLEKSYLLDHPDYAAILQDTK